ncbi:MAG: class I SAM-dependent methyltransferase [Desulfobulbaceae bacterium]|nr:class I SAM-dependent methyltransferase [Desulfobulbaceae bacterium]
MKKSEYLMENDDESFRLEIKIDEKSIKRQAEWAGIKPGMRVADLGCGSGKTTSILHELVQPDGSVVGVDGSSERLAYARKKYGGNGIEYIAGNLNEPLDHHGSFDFIWCRFVLEYARAGSFNMVRNFTASLKPGGILCLVDLDHNPLNHYGASEHLERTFSKIMQELEEKFDFDPYIGRKLYSFLYDLGYQDIDVCVENNRVTFGRIDPVEVYNIMKKIEIVPKKINFRFEEFPGGYEEFYREAVDFFLHPRRFSYTPLILCRGKKPLEG